jgi:hypothetical protein
LNARFSTYAEAARYAAERQSEGLYAKISQEAYSGQQNENGEEAYLVSVTSPQDLPEESAEPLSPAEQLLIAVIRFSVLALLGVAAGWALLELIAYLFQGGIVPVLLILGALACSFFALAGWSKLLSVLVGRSRGEGRPLVLTFGIAFIGAVLVGLTLWIF